MGRAPCCEKVGLRRGRWTAEEDKTLKNYIQANGEGAWRSLPKNAGLLRCGKSCRLRWINYLRSDLKRGNISAEEEEIIFKLHESLGNRWSLIARHLLGRTDNEIKNYWNSHLSRKIHNRGSSSNKTQPPILMDLPKAAGIANKQRGKKKKKSSSTTTIDPRLLEEPKETDQFLSSEVEVPMPQTPTLEKESWQEENMGNILLCLDDVMSNGEESGPNIKVLTFAEEERENNVMVSSEESESGAADAIKIAASEDLDSDSVYLSSSSGEWYSCPSPNSYFDGGMLHWDLDGAVQGSEEWGVEEKMLPWLWGSTDNGEGYCNEVGAEIDCEKQNAMIAWLLS